MDYLSIVCDELLLPIIVQSNNLHIKQISKKYLNLFNKNKNIYSHIVINNVHMIQLTKVPYSVLSIISEDMELFVDILKKSHLSAKYIRKSSGFNVDLDTILNPDYDPNPFMQGTNMWFKHKKNHGWIHTYHVVQDQCIYKKKEFIFNNIDNIINKYIDNEINFDKIIRFINAFHHIEDTILSDRFVFMPYKSEDTALNYCAHTNKFKLYLKIFESFDAIDISEQHTKCFIEHQNIKAIEFIRKNSQGEINPLWMKFYGKLNTIRQHSVKCHANKVFDKYYYSKINKKKLAKIVILINLSIKYNNIYAFTKMMKDKRITDLLCSDKCTNSISKTVMTFFDAITYSSMCNDEFFKIQTIEIIPNIHKLFVIPYHYFCEDNFLKNKIKEGKVKNKDKQIK